MYSVVTHKATRAPMVVSSEHSRQAAITLAGELYDASKIFAKHGTLASGVSVLVFTDVDAMRIQELKTLSPAELPKIVYQCGSW